MLLAAHNNDIMSPDSVLVMTNDWGGGPGGGPIGQRCKPLPALVTLIVMAIVFFMTAQLHDGATSYRSKIYLCRFLHASGGAASALWTHSPDEIYNQISPFFSIFILLPHSEFIHNKLKTKD